MKKFIGIARLSKHEASLWVPKNSDKAESHAFRPVESYELKKLKEEGLEYMVAAAVRFSQVEGDGDGDHDKVTIAGVKGDWVLNTATTRLLSLIPREMVIILQATTRLRDLLALVSTGLQIPATFAENMVMSRAIARRYIRRRTSHSTVMFVTRKVTGRRHAGSCILSYATNISSSKDPKCRR